MDEPDLSFLLDSAGRAGARPPVDSVVERCRRRRARRAKALGSAAALLLVVGGGVGVGLSQTSSGSGGRLTATAGRIILPHGLRLVSKAPGGGSEGFDSAAAAPSIAPCGQISCNSATFSSERPVLFARHLAGLRLVAYLLGAPHSAPVIVWNSGWKPPGASGVASGPATAGGIGTASGAEAGAAGSPVMPRMWPLPKAERICVSGEDLLVVLERPGGGPPLGELEVPAGRVGPRAIDVVSSAVLGRRLEVVVTRTAPRVRDVRVDFGGGLTLRQVPRAGWSLFAIPLRAGPRQLVEVTAGGAARSSLGRAVVPARGALAIEPLSCPASVLHPLPDLRSPARSGAASTSQGTPSAAGAPVPAAGRPSA